ncbi:MAG: mRNA surveillance protein pelota [Thermoplasmata archaeon]
MKVLYKNTKNRILKVLIDNDEDLWAIYKILKKGDIVRAHTYRKDDSISDKLRPDKMERIRVFLGIQVDSFEFSEYTYLRVKGIIREGIDVGKYHTLSIEVGDTIEIEKNKWDMAIDRILSYAEEEKNQEKVLFVSIDSTEAVIAIVNGFKVSEIGTVENTNSTKDNNSNLFDDSFFKKIHEIIKRHGVRVIALVGPGFFKEVFYNWLKEADYGTSQKCHVFRSSMSGISGVYEVIRSGNIASILKDMHFYKEEEYIDTLMKEISKEGLYSYGFQDIDKALDMNAVSVLLVVEDIIHDEKVEKMIDKAERQGADLFIFRNNTESGKKLKSLGSIAALLRFKV